MTHTRTILKPLTGEQIITNIDSKTPLADPPPEPEIHTNGQNGHTPANLSEAFGMVQEALRYAEIGWFVVPLHQPLFKMGKLIGCTCERYKRSDKYKKWLEDKGLGKKFDPDFECPHPGKHPRFSNWEKLATTNAAQIREWWKKWPNANIGVAAGKSGLLEIDGDKYKENYAGDDLLTMEEKKTPTVLSGGGGENLVFLMPPGKDYGNEEGDLPEGVNIRGYGGQFVVPPSVHYSGRRYEWEEGYSPWEKPPQPLPEKIITILDEAQKGAGGEHQVNFTTTTTEKPDLTKWRLSANALEKIKNAAPLGERSEADASVCTSLCYAGATDDDILAVFQHYPIGTEGKYSEGGEKYLTRTIASARRFVAAHPRNGAQSPEAAQEFTDKAIKHLRLILEKNAELGAADQDEPEVLAKDWANGYGARLYGLTPEQLAPVLTALRDVGLSQTWIDKEFPKLIKKAYRRTLPLSQQIEGDLEDWGYSFWLNDMDDTLWQGDRRMDDPARAILRTRARDNGYGGQGNPKSLSALDDVCIALAAKYRRHPVRDWLNSLEWDGQDHIAKLASYFTELPDVPKIQYADKTERTRFHAFLRRWLINAVAKQMGDTNAVRNNFVLVLAMGQGKGKSHFASWICPLKDYFVEKSIAPESRDCKLLRVRNFVWEIMELGATTKKQDVEALKGFVTGTVTTERQAYGHFDTIKPSVASYIGTVNPDGSGFLSDTTGNRRFAVVDLANIDWAYSSEIDPAQVWAQAVAIWRADNLAYRWTDEELAAQTASTEAHMEVDLFADMLRRVFEVNTSKTDWRVSSSEILEALRTYGGLSRGSDKAQGKELAKSLKSQWGIIGKRSHGLTYYVGLHQRDKLVPADNLISDDEAEANGL